MRRLSWISQTWVRRQLREKELQIPGNLWPMFVYENETYDDEEPWKGLFRGDLIVKGFKHIFTSPTSVDKDPKATRAGNAKIHGMTSVTPASIAYVATQVRFALSSAGAFCRTDTETDSESFYTSVLELFEDSEEQEEVQELLTWWNSKIFPSFSNPMKPIPANSVYSRIKEKRAALKALAASSHPNPRS
ncbi:hypothetical protein EST38_g3669 [Candolleomyces aberdarensis]|uniref:Uncharacterized protein n=1 Tax=Candolleomyces aberdarensis TaxID=2316362 RepID=A0A4Q2DRP5_9AGAR|nr:hypothetical protein EST38_g3669 [Candolleomyces aberdarensis]